MVTAFRILRNSAFSFLASLAAKAANLVVFVLIARRLSEAEVGVYSLALTYNVIFVQVTSLGLDQLLARDVARNRDQVGRYAANFMLIRLLLSVLTYGLLVVVVTSVIRYEQATAHILYLVGLTVIFDSVTNICHAVFIAFERLIYVTCTSLAMGLFKVGATWIGLQRTDGLPLLVGVILGTSLVGMLFSLGAVYWRCLRRSPRWRIDVGVWPEWLGQAFPFVFVTLFYILDYQLDVVLLSAWQGEEAVGIYGAATTILFALLSISQAFREAIFPVMARLYPTDMAALRRLYRGAARWLYAISLPIAVGGTLLGRDLMPFLYKSGFHASGRVLQIVIWSLLFLFLNVPNARLMIVAGKQRELAWYAILSMSANLLINVFLIPRYSHLGAAVARVASAALFFALIYGYTRRHLLQCSLLAILPRPAIAAAAMGVVIALLSALPLPIVVGAGAISYALALWLVGFVSDEERLLIRQLVHRLLHREAQRWIG